nr:ThiF family adenylyltransferase [Caenimonas sp. SL110]
MNTSEFNYDQAFARNLGWVTPAEQRALRNKTVAIGGMGGVGGHHLLALVRLGIGNFRIADNDHFELANFNRQAGATIGNVGASKTETMARMAREINPQVKIEIWHDGLGPDNLYLFLSGADLYIDGLDFFAFDIRAATFAACARLKVPAVTAAPLGMGAAWLTFMPGKMTFEQYFQWGDRSRVEKAARFLVGLTPGMRPDYLVDPSRVDLESGAGPSTPMACYLCAGIAATEALKILLGRGRIVCAPFGLHFDAYNSRMVRTWQPLGNANPLQRLKIAVVKRRMAPKSKTPALVPAQ